MKLTRMKTNRITSPLGFELRSLSFSWTVEDTDAKNQIWARVQVSRDSAFQQILWDSGENAEISSVDCPVPLETLALQPRTRYWWRAMVQADSGELAVSEPAWFETSKMGEPWQAQWITPNLEKHVHPLLRRSFLLEEEPVRARAYATGLGLYELSVNGQKAGDEYLAPGCTAYDKRLQYQTYDVTNLLHKGVNTLGAMLGNGWAKGRFGFGGIPDNFETPAQEGTPREAFVNQFLFLMELRVELADGREVVIGTGDDWQCAPSPVTLSSLYDGEAWDQNREIPGWDTPQADEYPWLPVTAGAPRQPLAEPSPRLSLPVKKHETFTPTLLQTPKGEWVLDLGQEIAGWFELQADFPKDTELRLQFGEILQDGCFYRDNLRTALCEYRFRSAGRPARIRPHFTFYGYRYVKVEGWPGDKPDVSAFTGCALYSDLEETGFLETGNEKVNRLILNARWSQKDNFVDVPTDCPQRDERMGWTGDAQIFCPTACFTMDCAAFYDKYCLDMWKEQQVREGCVSYVAPVIASTEPGPDDPDGGACGWADAAAIVPWTSYVFNGGKEKLREHFDSMKTWVDWVRREDANTGNTRLWLALRPHYGDWVALDGPRYGLDPEAVRGATDVTFLCSVYYFRSASIVSEAAGVLGMEEIQAEYAQLAEEIRQAIQKEYFTPGGRFAVPTQTGLALVLRYGLTPEAYKEKTFQALLEQLKGSLMHLRAGFLGVSSLCPVLSQFGDSKDAYTLLLQEDFPSWLYEVNMGATTIWERWNALLPDGHISGTGMNSMNHYAYGSIVEWMYQDMCGLNPLAQYPGFKRVRLEPRPDARIGYAKARVNSPAGPYESGWQASEDGGFTYAFSIPFDGKAELVLHGETLEGLQINGVPAKEAGVGAREEEGCVKALLPAGSWQICRG